MTFFVCLESWELCVWVLSLCCDPVVVPWCRVSFCCRFLLRRGRVGTWVCSDVLLFVVGL